MDILDALRLATSAQGLDSGIKKGILADPFLSDAVRDAVQQLYLNAGAQSPIYQDKGGNFRDGLAEGRMDCADHSTNTTTFLNYLAAQGWLQYHSVGKPVYRLPRIIDLHYAAQLIENGSGEKWAVDSWFEDFGAPPAVVDLKSWKKGWKPPE